MDEFRDMVKALHRAGIEINLDVVFNHTAEGDQGGPTLCFRGLDNSAYYILERDRSRYANYTGTGNTLNANHPIVRRMIVDGLRYWVETMHVDGFRFDNARRLLRDVAHERERLSLNQLIRQANKAWHGVTLDHPNRGDCSHSFAFGVELKKSGVLAHFILNAYWEPLEFELPPVGGATRTRGGDGSTRHSILRTISSRGKGRRRFRAMRIGRSRAPWRSCMQRWLEQGRGVVGQSPAWSDFMGRKRLDARAVGTRA